MRGTPYRKVKLYSSTYPCSNCNWAVRYIFLPSSYNLRAVEGRFLYIRAKYCTNDCGCGNFSCLNRIRTRVCSYLWLLFHLITCFVWAKCRCCNILSVSSSSFLTFDAQNLTETAHMKYIKMLCFFFLLGVMDSLACNTRAGQI